jgi:hypothetical protein
MESSRDPNLESSLSRDEFSKLAAAASTNALTDLTLLEGTHAVRASEIRFSEDNEPWRPVPRWADFLLSFGFAWRTTAATPRRIALISMPCDSAAAGLIALGAMRKVLETDEANDTAAHFERIKALTANGAENWFLRHKSKRLKGRFVVEKIDRGMVWVHEERSKTRVRTTITPKDANDWQFEGEAPVQALAGNPVPYDEFYAGLIPGAEQPLAANLRLSDSRVCFAGRVGGERASRRALEGVRFQTSGRTSDLSELLTIQAWSPGLISRVTFFNARTRKLDRATGIPQVIIADGDQAFLKVIETEAFRNGDVVGVIHRTMERNRLEAVGNKMADLSQQWYSPDTQASAGNQSPKGITISVLRRV